MNIITRQAALAIFHKVENSKISIAIFAEHGSWQATKVNTTNFARLVEREPEKLIGIFDINTRLEWLEEDLEAAGIK